MLLDAPSSPEMVESPHQRNPLPTVPADLLNSVKLVIFDFDGVIVDSEVISLSTLKLAFDACGMSMSDDEVRTAFLGKSKASIFAYLSSAKPDIDHDQFSDVWETKLFARFRAELRAIPGLSRMLSHLEARGIPFCIASSASSTRIDVALKAVDLKDRFPHVFSADHVRRGKPAPDLFLHAAKTLGADPAQCLVIEDSPFGVQAAQAAQMRSIGFVGGTHLCDVREAHEAELISLGAEIAVAAYDELIDPT